MSMNTFFRKLKEKLFTKKEKVLTPKQQARIDFMNRYSLILHALLAFLLVFFVEVISRRDLFSATFFMDAHTRAYFYNSFLVFCSLNIAYLFKRRAFARILISSFWMILGIINGCVLANRVTPFGFTDLKCIPDLLTMTNTNYFTPMMAVMVIIGAAVFAIFCVALYIKGPIYKGNPYYITTVLPVLVLLFLVIPLATEYARQSNILAVYFSNIAQGYEKYGFIYGFSSSVVDRGMKEPEDYAEETIAKIQGTMQMDYSATTVKEEDAPNIILILLESFVDPYEYNFLELNEDPTPTFHELEKNYSSGYLTVPVVGAGTANTEFELLTGMSLQYFGTGEYPYKTVLQETDCESIASDLSKIGYATHAVHNNGGNFYSRVNAFSMMGFDSFTSKEFMDIKSYTPNGSWANDSILVNETIKTLSSTPKQPDFTYTITVGTHGDYPKEHVIDSPLYTVSGIEDEETRNSWTYYFNQLNKTDTFLADLIVQLNRRKEKSIIIAFGDHLPTMGLTDSDMVSGDIYKTKYVTWNNFGLEKKDADLYAYQLMASVTNDLGIHEGTIMKYHQTQMSKPTYLQNLEMLQYDLLYGERYCYKGEDLYPATEIVMGVKDIIIDHMDTSPRGSTVFIHGENFTPWSEVYINDSHVETSFIDEHCVWIYGTDIEDMDTVTVKQIGSNNTVFRTSNAFIFDDPRVEDTENTETTESVEPSEDTEPTS